MKDTKGFTAKFDAASKSITSLKSDFTQEKHLAMMEQAITSTGIFMYQKENKIRLEYISPFPYLMVLNSGKVYVKDGKKVSKYDANSNKMFRQINEMMLGILKGDVLHGTKYTVSYFENEGAYLLELIPLEKSVKSMMQKIKIRIDRKKLSVSRIDLIEPSGDYTRMTFSNIVQNISLSNAQFVVK